MANSEYGYFQVIVASTDEGQSTPGQTTNYKINLQGNYKLQLVYIDINSVQTTPSLRLIQLYSPQLTQFYGNVSNLTLMYPRTISTEFAESFGTFEYCYYINLNNQLSIQFREEDGSPMIDFDFATLTFKFEKM